MEEFQKSEQVILASGVLHYNNAVLVVRANKMIEKLNDTEYYTLPVWEVSFGNDPKNILQSELEKLLGKVIKTDVEVIDTNSFIRNRDTQQHVVELIYKVQLSKKACSAIKECEEMQFIKKREVNKYIFSDRIKQILKDSF